MHISVYMLFTEWKCFCFFYWIQSWDYEYSMHTLNILSLNVNGLNSAVKRTRVLEYLHRKSISCALIQETHLKQSDVARFQNKQPRLIGNTCLYIHFCNTVIMYLAARFVAVSKWNVQRVVLKHTFNTWPWHVFITLVQARIAVFLLCCLRYVLRSFIIQISGECR